MVCRRSTRAAHEWTGPENSRRSARRRQHTSPCDWAHLDPLQTVNGPRIHQLGRSLQPEYAPHFDVERRAGAGRVAYSTCMTDRHHGLHSAEIEANDRQKPLNVSTGRASTGPLSRRPRTDVWVASWQLLPTTGLREPAQYANREAALRVGLYEHAATTLRPRAESSISSSPSTAGNAVPFYSARQREVMARSTTRAGRSLVLEPRILESTNFTPW